MGMTANQIRLIEAVAKKDYEKMKGAALACCAEDTTQKNKYHVQRCKNLLECEPLMMELPADIKSFVVAEDLSNYREARYYLSSRERKLFERISKMRKAAIELQERGVKFLNATLLYGESGVGKTEFARYVAYKMDLPFLYLNFSNVVDSHLGGTAKNISKVFEFIQLNKCVLMLDELDAVGSSRAGITESAGKERAFTTVALMQHLDRLTNEHLILSATNLPEEIDSALKRRFTIHHEVIALSDDEKIIMIENILKDVNFECIREHIAEYVHSERCGKSPAQIWSHLTMRMADSLIENKEIRL